MASDKHAKSAPNIALRSPFLVDFEGSFKINDAHTKPPKSAPESAACKADLSAQVARIAHQQRKLYASNTWALLLVFQAMDAAGKDGTIRAVLSGVDPSGCEASYFKAPSSRELDHDFLWRTHMALPERGRIGIFNRSYYEEVLVVRVHPELLAGQQLPWQPKKLDDLFEARYASIRDHELHLARNGVAVVKFFLNVSRDEQKKRFLDRIDDEDANWKFSETDVAERKHWPAYMKAYQKALRETSRPWAPWYAVPADDKAFMRLSVANIIADTLEHRLAPRWPELPKDRQARLGALRKQLLAEK